jgi:hypothetical protein
MKTFRRLRKFLTNSKPPEISPKNRTLPNPAPYKPLEKGAKIMFCPNCGSENKNGQNFCRLCGLKLDAISQAVAEQTPSQEYLVLKRRKEVFEKMGVFSLSVSGIIGLAFIFTKVIQYKLMLFGEDVLFWSGFAALVVFSLLSVFFFNYPKLFMNFDKLDPRLSPSEEKQISQPTAKLIEDRPFEPAASVTENSTELLLVENKTRKFE